MGDERICRKVNKPGNHRNDHGMVDRKLDLLARELKRYRYLLQGFRGLNGSKVMCGLLIGTLFHTLVVPY